MSDQSRRGFLKFAGASAVAASVIAAPSLSGIASADTESGAPAHEAPFVAWVKDPKAGEIAILVGQHELVYTDKKLAKRLAQAAHRAHAAG